MEIEAPADKADKSCSTVLFQVLSIKVAKHLISLKQMNKDNMPMYTTFLYFYIYIYSNILHCLFFFRKSFRPTSPPLPARIWNLPIISFSIFPGNPEN